MKNEYEKSQFSKKSSKNPFASNWTIGIFGMMIKVYRNTEILNKKIQNPTYIWIEKFKDDNFYE